MTYKTLARYYDEFNSSADYDALSEFIRRRLSFFRMQGCTIADLCCGTGELTLRLALAGYDMIGVDISSDMLAVFREKIRKSDTHGILLLCQDIKKLDLFGTVDCMISTFDALNHIGKMSQLDKAFARISMFLNINGLFIFDMNTPYKHKNILARNCFKYEAQGAECYLTHTLKNDHTSSVFNINIDKHSVIETLTEYFFEEDDIRRLCSRHGLRVISCVDGENFEKLRPHSHRYMFTAQKINT